MRCLIVDDEVNIRNSYKLLGQWDALGIDEVLEASNGEKGMELVRALRPEIILTDMSMNTMDGIEFMRQLDGMDYRPQIIVLSGYTDFEYVHSALLHHAVDYLLKPINAQRLNAVLEKAVSQFLQGSQAPLSAPADRVSRVSFTNLKIVRDFSASHRYFSLCMPLILNFEEAMRATRYGQPDLLCLRIQQITEAAFRAQLREDFIMLHFQDDVKWAFVCIIGADEDSIPQGESALRQALETAQRQLELLRLRILWGYLFPFFAWEDFPGKFQTLKDGLYSLPVRTPNAVRHIFENASRIPEGPSALTLRSGEIKRAIYQGDSGEACRIVRECCEALSRSRTCCARQVMRLGMEVQNLLGDVLGQGKNSSETLFQLNQGWTTLSDNLDSPARWSEIICECVQYTIDNMHPASAPPLIQEVLEYINENYAERLSLADLSARFFVSQQHLSRMIRKETGRTFVDHLTDCRLKNAIVLLRTTDLSTMEIAMRVGFTDASYMSRVFHKMYHITPTALRKQKSEKTPRKEIEYREDP